MKKYLFILLLLFAFNYSTIGQNGKYYSDSAKVLKQNKKFGESQAWYLQAKKTLSIDSSSTLSYAAVCNALGDILTIRSSYDSALAEFAEARMIIQKISGNESTEMAGNANLTGITWFRKGVYDSSEFYFRYALDIRKKILSENHPDYAASCISLGNLYVETGKLRSAEPLYLQALKIKEINPGKNHPDYARICNNLADLYRRTGEFEKAEPLAILAKEIRGKVLGTKNEFYAISCTNLANLYSDMGQYDKAEKNYIEARAVRADVYTKMNPSYADACNILADLYTRTGQYSKAEDLYKEALEVRAATISKTHRDYAQTCNNLGSLYINMGNFTAAEFFLLEAKNIWEKTLAADNPAIFYNKTTLAILYRLKLEYVKSVLLFKESLVYWKNNFGEDHPEYLQVMQELARLYRNTGNTKASASWYKRTFELQYKMVNKFFRFTNENEKQAYLENITGAGDEHYSFHIQQNNSTGAGDAFNISLLTRSLILSSSQQLRQLIYNSNDSALTRLYLEWSQLKEQLAILNTKGDAGKSEQAKMLEQDADELEKQISKRSGAFKTIQQKPDWKGLQAKLKKNEAAIQFEAFRYYNGRTWSDSILYAALILKNNGKEPTLITLFEQKRLDSILRSATSDKAITQLYTRGVIKEVKTNTSASVYEILWKPLQASLGGIETIYFAPAGDLLKLSFAALPLGNGKVLSDQFTLVQMHSTAALLHNADDRINDKARIQLYGGIEYDSVPAYERHIGITQTKTSTQSKTLFAKRGGTFDFLKGTKVEAESIGREAVKAGFDVVLLTGRKATEESFKAVNGTASPEIIHIATHGFFFPPGESVNQDSIKLQLENNGKAFRHSENPLFRSGLLFAGANKTWQGQQRESTEDGILTSYEISAGMYLPNTKLVVLSACETALGDIKGSEGVYGLQRAFTTAGVQNLVMSLWEVPDFETAEFMQLFYKNIFSKKTISQAFSFAQEIMKNKYRKDPYKWAAWILVK